MFLKLKQVTVIVLFPVAMKYVNTSNFKGLKDDQLTILGYSASLWGSHIHRQAESDCIESGRATYSLYFFLPYTIQDPKLGMVPPTIWLGLFPSVPVIKTALETQTA